MPMRGGNFSAKIGHKRAKKRDILHTLHVTGGYSQYLNCRGDASPHRELASPNRDLASPHRDLGVPPSRIKRCMIRRKRVSLQE